MLSQWKLVQLPTPTSGGSQLSVTPDDLYEHWKSVVWMHTDKHAHAHAHTHILKR